MPNNETFNLKDEQGDFSVSNESYMKWMTETFMMATAYAVQEDHRHVKSWTDKKTVDTVNEYLAKTFHDDTWLRNYINRMYRFFREEEKHNA